MNMIYLNKSICKKYGLKYFNEEGKSDRRALKIIHTSVLLMENPRTFDSYQSKILKNMNGYISIKRQADDDPGWFRISKVKTRIEGTVINGKRNRRNKTIKLV